MSFMSNELEGPPNHEIEYGPNEDDVLRPVSISLETARELSEDLKLSAEYDRIHDRDKTPEDNHSIETTKSLNKRFSELLASQLEKDDPNLRVTIMICGREIQHYNQLSGPEAWAGITADNDIEIQRDIRMFGGLIQTTPEEDEHILQGYRESYLDIKTQMLGAYIDLNLSSIKAGIKPRQDFLEYYEGVLPQPQR